MPPLRKRKRAVAVAEEVKTVEDVFEEAAVEGSGDNEKDALLMSKLSAWLCDWLPPGVAEGSAHKWDIYATLHSDTVSIVEVGRVHNTQVQVQSAELSSFLADDDSDDDNHNNDDCNSEQNLECFRVVLDFDSANNSQMIELRELSDSPKMPKCLAVFQRKSSGKFDLAFCRDQKWLEDDSEIQTLCESASDICDVDSNEYYDSDDSNVSAVDLEQILKAYSKKEIMSIICKHFADSEKKKGTPEMLSKYDLSSESGKNALLRDLRAYDRDMLELFFARFASFDESIVDSLIASQTGDLIALNTKATAETEDCLEALEQVSSSSSFSSESEELEVTKVLDVCEKALKCAKRFRSRGYQLRTKYGDAEKGRDIWLQQCYAVLQAIDSTLFSFLLNAISEEWLSTDEIRRNGRLSYFVQSVEKDWEHLHTEGGLEFVERISKELKKWKTKMTPILGPIFSDNLLLLQKAHSTVKRAEAGDSPPIKKRKLHV